MTKPAKPPAPPEFDPAYVRDISLAVYLDRLGPDGTVKGMTRAETSPELLRTRAGSYDPLTKAYLRALNAVTRIVTIDKHQGVNPAEGMISTSGAPITDQPELFHADSLSFSATKSVSDEPKSPPTKPRKPRSKVVYYVAKRPKSTK